MTKTFIATVIVWSLTAAIISAAIMVIWNALFVGDQSIIGVQLPHLTFLNAFGLRIFVQLLITNLGNSKN
jgi:hypothetical protein